MGDSLIAEDKSPVFQKYNHTSKPPHLDDVETVPETLVNDASFECAGLCRRWPIIFCPIILWNKFNERQFSSAMAGHIFADGGETSFAYGTMERVPNIRHGAR
jgi:hypothetical protein